MKSAPSPGGQPMSGSSSQFNDVFGAGRGLDDAVVQRRSRAALADQLAALSEAMADNDFTDAFGLLLATRSDQDAERRVRVFETVADGVTGTLRQVASGGRTQDSGGELAPLANLMHGAGLGPRAAGRVLADERLGQAVSETLAATLRGRVKTHSGVVKAVCAAWSAALMAATAELAAGEDENLARIAFGHYRHDESSAFLAALPAGANVPPLHELVTAPELVEVLHDCRPVVDGHSQDARGFSVRPRQGGAHHHTGGRLWPVLFLKLAGHAAGS